MKKSTTADRGLTWTTNPPSPKELRKKGYTVVQFGDLRSKHIEPARQATPNRVSLDNAAASLLRLLDENPRLAVLGVPSQTVGDLRDIYSFLVEPAFRRDIDLLLGVDQHLEDLDAATLVAPDPGYPWTFERLKFIAERYHRVQRTDGLPPLTPIEGQLLTAMRSAGLMPQVQYGISKLRVDFAFIAERLVVEADGRAWHDAERDAARDAYLDRLGWETIRFSGSKIYRDVDGVVASILAALEERESVLAYTTDLPAEPQRQSWWRRIVDWFRGRQSDLTGADGSILASIKQPIPSWKGHLDEDQRRAVDADEGVVQIIAPAGSGKTTTMIARVQELLSRGVPANRILCTTFNRATVTELKEQLREKGISDVEVRNFHGLGRHILDKEEVLRSEIGTISYGQWRRLAKQAMDAINGIWIDAPTAQTIVSDYKLARMWTPETARKNATTVAENTAAEIYTRYEQELERIDRNDFDDLVAGAVRLLQSDDEARRRWQGKWESVLVDEYQDIEPAQEMLIQLVAAPEDSLFAVGDEDQCIYAWRRATVERIVMLDTVYPGLERVVLSTSYRCPPVITEAAKSLISLNKRRFPKPIKANPEADVDGHIELIVTDTPAEGAAAVAKLLVGINDPQGMVVLARTSRLLQKVVEACIDAGVSVNAPPRSLRPSDAEETLLAYLRLLSSPLTASDSDVRRSFRVPNRYLPKDQEATITKQLKTGANFTQAVNAITVPSGLQYALPKLAEWGALMDSLKGENDAAAVIQTLRTTGRLDVHYASVEQMSPNDQIETETLDDITATAEGLTPSQLAARLEQRASMLANLDSKDGVELNTIHGSKGREWDTVILFGADADQLPHFRTVSEAETEEEALDALEDERRLAYVAITRTKRKLAVVTTGTPSPFLAEAGISASVDGQSPPAPAQKKQTPKPQPKKKPSTPRGSLPGTQRTKKPKVITAKYAGTCSSCRNSYEPGSRIANVNNLWIHESCS